ncbi:MAG: RNA polymerase sigma factor [Blastocatellia bacterium]
MPKEELNPQLEMETGNASDVALRLEAALPGLIEETMTPEQEVTGLFEQWRGPIYEYLVMVFGRPAEAEEVAQDAFLQLCNALRSGQTIHNTKGWLFRVAHNLAINRRKHDKFFDPLEAGDFEELCRQLPDTAPSPEQRLLQQEKFTRLYAAMKRLSLQEKQCLHLRAEGFRYREIGEILGVSADTVNEYLRRAMRKLREQ